jgi:hypothetical protein
MTQMLAHLTPGDVFVLAAAFVAGMAAGAAALVRFLRRQGRR